MADRVGLEILGFILAGVTLAVFVVAAVVVRNNLDTRMADRTAPVMPISLTPTHR